MPSFSQEEITLDNVTDYLKRVQHFEEKFQCDFNKFYGTDKLLLKMLGLPSWFQTNNFRLDHAVFQHDEVLPYHLESKKPLVVFRGDHKVKINEKGKQVYLSRNPSIELFSKLKSRATDGSVVVFPGHSTHWVDATFKSEDFIKELNNLPDYFGEIRICLYWKDIINGMHMPYLKHGFKVVSAGHMEDPLFGDKMYNILASGEYTCSNEIGSYTFYSVAAGIPFFYFGPNATKVNNGDRNIPGGEYVYESRLDNLFKFDLQNTKPTILDEVYSSCEAIFHINTEDEGKIRRKLMVYNLKIWAKKMIKLPIRIVRYVARRLSITK